MPTITNCDSFTVLQNSSPFSLIFLQVVFLHPVHNYALVAYDPSSLGSVGASAVQAAKLLPGMVFFL